jgi:hypothetical protein
MRRLLLILLLLVSPAAVGAKTPAKKSGSDFIRVSRDQNGPRALELAVTTYRSKNGVTVDLVGAVHVGEKSYYRSLNQDFSRYDAVLYELIAPTGEGAQRPIPIPGDSDNPLSALQGGLKDMLGLSFQLDEVNYGAANFVHADISPDEFWKSVEKKGESFQATFMRLLTIGMENPSTASETDISDLDIIGILTRGPSKRDRVILRRIMADSFSDIDLLETALNGPGGSTIVSERNKRALAVLGREIKKGKKHLAIYYGVAHMPDMSKRLEHDLGFQRQKSRWMPAWNLAFPAGIK